MTISLPSRPFEGVTGWLSFLLAALLGISVSVPKLHLNLFLHMLFS